MLAIGVALAGLAAGCGGGSRSQKEISVCRSIHENPALFNAVVGPAQASGRGRPERAYTTPVRFVTDKLGKPAVVTYPPDPLFEWNRYGNTAYLIANLAASAPGHRYVASKACNWSNTKATFNAIIRNPGG